MEKKPYAYKEESVARMTKGSEMRNRISAILSKSFTNKEAIEALSSLITEETRNTIMEIQTFALNRDDAGYGRSTKYLSELRQRLRE
jgi:hypothetical protein